LIIIVINQNILDIMKRPRINRSQGNEPIEIPYPEKVPEFEPLHDPVTPEIYPDENPVEKPPQQPTEIPPYTLPKPSEFP
jgi:hypothetical protein